MRTFFLFSEAIFRSLQTGRGSLVLFRIVCCIAIFIGFLIFGAINGSHNTPNLQALFFLNMSVANVAFVFLSLSRSRKLQKFLFAWVLLHGIGQILTIAVLVFYIDPQSHGIWVFAMYSFFLLLKMLLGLMATVWLIDRAEGKL